MADRIATFVDQRGPLTTSRLAQLVSGSESAVAIAIGKSKGRFVMNDDQQWVLNQR